MPVHLELINTGTELLLGAILNTNQQWLCRQLSDAGYTVQRQVLVSDSAPAIQAAIRDALPRADWIITTGGLGPTSDDLTRDGIAALLGLPLQSHPKVLAHIQAFYHARKRTMPSRAALQALVPAGATVLPNQHGTAPGLLVPIPPDRFRDQPAWLAMLPGPPRELQPMFRDQLLPLIRRTTPPPGPVSRRLLRTTGLPESLVEERIAGPLRPWTDRGLEIGYCARPGEVDIRLTAHGSDAESVSAAASARVRELVASAVYGENDTELETVIVQLLTEKQRTVAVAESCTGGRVADRITNVPGASIVFLGGWITYSNAAKQQWLGVRPETIATHGAVSPPVAAEMAEGARQRSGADYAIAVTGIAGPGGGSAAKPVGTVYIALASPSGTEVIHSRNSFDRPTFKHVTSQQTLDLLRRRLLETSSP